MNRAREWIHCNEAYRRGLTGKGVGVAILDTGVFLHPDLENCVYGFRDFLKKKQQPYDDNGHGTHVAGMIAGSGTASARSRRYQRPAIASGGLSYSAIHSSVPARGFSARK